MYSLIVFALLLLAIWAILIIVFKSAGFLVNLLLLAAIVLLALWAIRRIRS